MSKKRAFVRYTKAGKIVPGSLVVTDSSHPQGPAKWSEVPADLCCLPENPCPTPNYGEWRVVTGGEAGDGVVLVDEYNPQEGGCPEKYTFIGPNDSQNNGWIYLTQYFSTTTCLNINYKWTSFTEGPFDFGSPPMLDMPVYWISSTEPTGIPGDIATKTTRTPTVDYWYVTIPSGSWFSIGIYSPDSCCGRGFLDINICETQCLPETPSNICVSGAGSPSVNGTYTFYGVSNGKNEYRFQNNIIKSISGGWFIASSNGSLYGSFENVSTPDLVTTWELFGGGQLPFPTLTVGSC